MSDCTHPAEAVTPMDAGEGFCAECQKAVLVGGNSDRPAPKPVAPAGLASLLEHVRTYIRQYVVLTAAQADTVTLWAAHTHAFDAAESTPYLAITSAEKRSGKTRLLEVLSLIVAHPWLTGRVSPAALYRRIHAERPTLLLDESDSAFKSGEEYGEALRGVLNTGHRAGGSTTVCVGQGASMSYTVFSTFAAKAISGIGTLPDTIEDRAVSISMKRKAPGEKTTRFRWRRAREEATPLKDRLEAWASASEALAGAEPDLPEALDDRAADGWEVPLAIADIAGEDWPQRGRIAALALSVGDGREDESEGLRLLADIRDIFAALGDPDKITSANLVRALIRLEEAPWSDLRGRPLTTLQLSKRLKPFTIKPRTIRLDAENTARGYLRDTFVPEWARYLPPPTPGNPTQVTQVTQATDTDTDAVSGVSGVSGATGMGKDGDNDGRRLYARSLWEQQGRPAKPVLRDGIKIIDVERFIDNASTNDLASFVTNLEAS